MVLVTGNDPSDLRLNSNKALHAPLQRAGSGQCRGTLVGHWTQNALRVTSRPIFLPLLPSSVFMNPLTCLLINSMSYGPLSMIYVQLGICPSYPWAGKFLTPSLSLCCRQVSNLAVPFLTVQGLRQEDRVPGTIGLNI